MPLSFSSLNPAIWTRLPSQKIQPNLINKKNEDQKGGFHLNLFQEHNEYIFFWIRGNSIPRKAHFVGPGE